MVFEACWRGTWDDTKYCTGEWKYADVVSHNAFDQSEGCGSGSYKTRLRYKYVSQQMKKCVQVPDVLNKRL